jgi:hypothetical protein
MCSAGRPSLGGPLFLSLHFFSRNTHNPPVFRSWFRIGLIFLIALCVTLMALWNRPYDRNADDAAYQITDVSVRRDSSFYWVDVTLKGPSSPNSSPPFTYLLSATDERIEHADLRVTEDQRSMMLRFWVEQSKLDAAWALSVNDERLRLKEAGSISLNDQQQRRYSSPRWH